MSVGRLGAQSATVVQALQQPVRLQLQLGAQLLYMYNCTGGGRA